MTRVLQEFALNSGRKLDQPMTNMPISHTDVLIDVRNASLQFEMSFDMAWTVKQMISKILKSLINRPARKYLDVLINVDFKAYPGDIIGIIGPNGSGKTTFLRIISGIYQLDQGSVQTNGRISSLLSLGTGFNLELSGFENIRMNALLFGMTKTEIDEKIDQICEFADIGDFIHSPMKYYSSGMIARLNFAIVIAIDPEIVLIDEIFSVGDLAFQEKSEKAINTMLEKAKCQLIVTHSLSLVEERCNRAILLDAGKIIKDGKPVEVVEHYKKMVSAKT